MKKYSNCVLMGTVSLVCFSSSNSQILDIPWVALLVESYLFNTASFVLRVFRGVKDHHGLLH